MATIAAEMILRCAANCSLSLNDFDIEGRPYHKNCGCALHNLNGLQFPVTSRVKLLILRT
ncbi:hypothetical protein Patl1_14830 [Pistacia atlantica]|uniref:Uncharacterized protein n=1 Tax=Pistacia atlantica TaxID=434234 RepID=A0ACC1AXV0_9ROSI|nr:hypothetical protein Patl1_14830 [Pistacia atlantica]